GLPTHPFILVCSMGGAWFIDGYQNQIPKYFCPTKSLHPLSLVRLFVCLIFCMFWYVQKSQKICLQHIFGHFVHAFRNFCRLCCFSFEFQLISSYVVLF